MASIQHVGNNKQHDPGFLVSMMTASSRVVACSGFINVDAQITSSGRAKLSQEARPVLLDNVF